MTDNDIVINVQNLYKTYNGGFKAVDGIDFFVKKKECFGLLGPNGAGKTTTMKIIYGKSEPDINTDTNISIFGYNPLCNSVKIKALSGIVPQQENLDLELNVRDNLLVYAKFYGMSKSDADKRIKDLLEFMELKEKEKTKVDKLSGGMQRRLSIARALLNNPKLIILDEPTTGLDPQVRHLIWNKLRELKNSGVTILLTTHYMEEAYQICDRIIIMDKGRKILEGNPRKLLENNIEKFVMEIHNIEPDNQYISDIYENLRHEFFNDVLFVFSNNIELLSARSEKLKELHKDYYIRHANLEDLFLKVTGRNLNELQ